MAREIILKDEGTYKGTILKHDLGLTAKGKPCVEFRVRFTHIENEELEWEELAEPFTRPVYIYLSEAAKDNARKTLQWLGYEEKTAVKLNPNHPEAYDFKGLEVFATCRHDEYNGKPKESWNLQRRRKASDQGELVKALAGVDEWYGQDDEAETDPASVSLD